MSFPTFHLEQRPNIQRPRSQRPKQTLSTVVGDLEIQVIVDVERVVLAVPDMARFFRVTFFCYVTANGKSARAKLLLLGVPIAERHRHVVHDPVLLVVQHHAFHQAFEELLLLRIGRQVLSCTDSLASAVLKEIELNHSRWSGDGSGQGNEPCTATVECVRRTALDRDSPRAMILLRRCRS